MPHPRPIAKAHQHPVGQGCFYTCDVFCPLEAPIRFVYDCGSLTGKKEALTREIEGYRQTLVGDSLDFLIVSHLDADHVNGLELLLDGSFQIEYAFLPYLTPLQRFIVGVRNAKESGGYYELLADPAAFLTARGVRRVVFVVRGDDMQELEPERPFDDGPPDEGAERVEIRGMEKTKQPPEGIRPLSGDKKTEAQPSSQASSSPEEEPYYVTDRRKLRVGPCWQVKFFNYDAFPDEAFAYQAIDDLEPIQTDTPTQTRWKAFYREVLRVMRLNVIDPHILLDAIRNELQRKKLQECYKLISKDHNNVSLVAWHGPRHRVGTHVECRSRDELKLRYSQHWGDRSYLPHSNGGTLLTGDISLRYDLPQSMTHYNGLIEETGLVQVPHHGSRRSWNSNLLNELSDPIFFLSAGARNKFGHPHLEVITDIGDYHSLHAGHEFCPVYMRVFAPV